QWMETQRLHYDKGSKRVYYLSLEFLMGRALANNIINMGLQEAVADSMATLGYSWEDICEYEVDAGLGNGGLGRLAACFLDSMATLDIPAYGYGLRYDYGIFRQVIENGYQVEQPDYWLRRGNPWEVERHDVAVPVHFGGKVITGNRNGRSRARWVETQPVMGIAYDTPIVGYGGRTVNTLRLWSTRAAEEFDFQDFNKGDYVEAVRSKVSAENLTKVLYPNDKLYLGKELRLKQQYLFVACSLHDILRRFKKLGLPWEEFPKNAAIQLNDTHPSLAIPELMRLLVDREGVDWELAWEITVKTMGYTNHTLMPEALEKWPVPMLEKLLPRHLQIIYLINHHFLQKVEILFPGDGAKQQRVSLVEEGETKQIRMANLSIVGSHSTNGVAALHTELLKSRLVPDLADIFPERFNNKTNGITQRRWLLTANPPLAALITGAIGSAWVTEFAQISRLKPFAEEPEFRRAFRDVKRTAKLRLAAYVKKQHGWEIDPDTLFDVQVKRIHEYKRQLLSALHLITLYLKLRRGEPANFVPRTVLFGGKAAPGYAMAKLIIKLINNIAYIVNNDPATREHLKVLFLPNYRVSLAERIFPASDLSEQISTAGTEASGTGNMKFMCNGALTIGTLDGANIEIVEEVGEENAFIFGLTADQVAELKPAYRPRIYYENDPGIRESIDLLASGHFNFGEPGIFDPIIDILLENDQYMHLADLSSYCSTQERAAELYRNQEEWSRRAILNIASSAKFSSDRTIREYADEIWHSPPCTVQLHRDPRTTLDEARADSGRTSPPPSRPAP
ncbi:MAG TPA: glycogen/starch/alpha-glucan phosphorylase, partial [Spirochaetia bacterium]|nr:glycogen/starch/alpha-glucan phosphorylase [Spirochaetia bacterium]